MRQCAALLLGAIQRSAIKPFVEAHQQQRFVVQRPDAVVDLLGPAPLSSERVARIERIVRHALVAEIFIFPAS